MVHRYHVSVRLYRIAIRSIYNNFASKLKSCQTGKLSAGISNEQESALWSNKMVTSGSRRHVLLQVFLSGNLSTREETNKKITLVQRQ